MWLTELMAARASPRNPCPEVPLILRRGELAGGMAQKGQLGVLRIHTAAIVCDPEKGHASVLQLNGNVLAPSVQWRFPSAL